MAFAVSAAHEWRAQVAVRSVEDALWAAHQIGGDPTQEATWVQFALEGLTQHGHASEAAWPYGEPAFPADRPTDQTTLDLQTPPAWQNARDTPTFAELTQQMALGAAFILTLEHHYPAWMAAHHSGVVDAPPASKTVGRHAVLVVGASVGTEDDYLIIKNSWGSDWADGGYARLSQRYFDNYLSDVHAIGM